MQPRMAVLLHQSAERLWLSLRRDQQQDSKTDRARSTGQVRANHGHAGPKFVAYLDSNRKLWRSWQQQRHQELTHDYQRLAGDNAYTLVDLRTHFAVDQTRRGASLPQVYCRSSIDPIEPMYALDSARTTTGRSASRGVVVRRGICQLALEDVRLQREVHEECRGPVLGNIRIQR